MESQLVAVAAALPGVICSYRQTADGKRTFPCASENCWDVYGFSPKELQISADAVFQRLHPDDLPHVLSTVEEFANSGQVWRDEFRYHHPKKGLLWLEGQSSPVREPNGDIIWHGYVQDITERKRAEQKLFVSEARYRAFFNSGLMGVIGWSIGGSITDANDTFLEMLGYSREDVLAGRLNWRQITPPEFDELDRIAVRNISANGVTLPFEKEYFCKDGSRLPVLLVAAALDESHRDGVAFVLDISKRKYDEAHVQRLYEERLNSVKTMAAGLAHEINQPLSATVTYLNVIKKALDRKHELSEINVEKTLEKAAAQVVRAGQIVSRLRDFIAHGEPDKIIVHVHDIIRSACKEALSEVREKGIAITLMLQASDDKVLADQVQIQQVLTNLIRNAKESMISSAVREITISTVSSESQIRVDVADTGSGISEDVKPGLFQPFTTTKADGMGVGLAISRTIIEAHDGTISVLANPDGGAIFTCTLPLAKSLVGLNASSESS